MKDENSVPAAQKMTDVSLSIFRSKFKKTRIQMILRFCQGSTQCHIVTPKQNNNSPATGISMCLSPKRKTHVCCGLNYINAENSGKVSKYYPSRRRSSAMLSQSPFFKVTLAAVLLSSFARIANAQQPVSPQAPVTLSEPVRATLYPEVICAHCIVPEWDRSYLLHREFDTDPALVTMYDRTGKKVLQARVVPQNAAKVSLIATGATHAGGILAAGGSIMTIMTDGTVWALGYDLDIHDSPDADKNVLRHYSFEKGLLGTFVSLDSISKFPDDYSAIASPMKSYLRCGKDRVLIYLSADSFSLDWR